MAKEFRIDHDKINNSQTITKVVAEEFKQHDLDTKRHIAVDVIDDPSTRQRVYKVKNTKYFGNWGHRG
jgi:siroheme synthase (precorrin-2 oxidase/ferrochelatase)